MTRDRKFDNGYYGHHLPPAPSSRDPISEVAIDDIVQKAFAYLREHAKSERSLFDNPAGVAIYPRWARLMTSSSFIFTNEETVFTYGFNSPMAVNDAHHVLAIAAQLASVESGDVESVARLNFALGKAVAIFDIRRSGVEKLAGAKTATHERLKRPKQFDDAALELAWTRVSREIKGERKQSQRIERAIELVGCSKSTFKRWLEKNEK